jgi:hypothetical protein
MPTLSQGAFDSACGNAGIQSDLPVSEDDCERLCSIAQEKGINMTLPQAAVMWAYYCESVFANWLKPEGKDEVWYVDPDGNPVLVDQHV